MPGQTDNSNLLAAENQEVVALNDITQAIENFTVPPAQLEVTLNTTGLETAIGTLQSTLVSTLDALRVVVKSLNFCCTTPTTTIIEPGTPGGGSPGDPPGDGQTEPEGTTEEIASRRCKMAMWLVDDFLNGVVEWGDTSGVDGVINGIVDAGLAYYSATILTIATAAVIAVLTEFTTPGPGPDDAIVTFLVTGIVGYIAFGVAQSHLDFAVLKQFIDTNRVKMICALTNAQNAYSAHSALMAAIDDTSPGLDAGNRRFVDRMLNTASLALLFYVDEEFSVLETWIGEQTTTCACLDDTPATGTPTNVYKCKAANYLFDNFVDSLEGWGTVATMSWYSTPTFITALSGGLLSSLLGSGFNLLYAASVAWAAFVAKVVSFLGWLFWYGADYFEAFDEIAAYFTTNKAAIICELYLAADVETARDAIEVHVDDYVGSVMTAHPEWADQITTYKDVVKSLLTTTVLNVLFETTPRTEITNYAPADFTACTECGGSTPSVLIKITSQTCGGTVQPYGERVSGHVDENGYFDQGELEIAPLPVWVNCNQGWVIKVIDMQIAVNETSWIVDTITHPSGANLLYWTNSAGATSSSSNPAVWPTTGANLRRLLYHQTNNAAMGNLIMTWHTP